MGEAAVIAPVVLALHPWHVRYGTEARGYAFILLLVPALLMALIAAARTGRWRPCLAVGGISFLLLYTNILSLHILVPAAASCLLLVLGCWRSGRDRLIVLARLAGGSLMGAMVAFPLMLPLLPQLRVFMQTGLAHGDLNLSWLQNAVCEFFTGVYWYRIDPSNPHARPWEIVARCIRGLSWVEDCCWQRFSTAGIVALWRHSWQTRCLLPALLLPAAELVAANGSQRPHALHMVFDHWTARTCRRARVRHGLDFALMASSGALARPDPWPHRSRGVRAVRLGDAPSTRRASIGADRSAPRGRPRLPPDTQSPSTRTSMTSSPQESARERISTSPTIPAPSRSKMPRKSVPSLSLPPAASGRCTFAAAAWVSRSNGFPRRSIFSKNRASSSGSRRFTASTRSAAPPFIVTKRLSASSSDTGGS